MHGQHPNAAILGDAREVWGVPVGMVPARSHLEGHRQFYRLDGRRQNLGGMNFVAHQGRPGMAVHHLLHRATEIDVDDRRAPVLVQLGRLGHHVGLTAGELDGHGEFFR